MPSAGVLPIKPLAQSRLAGPMGIGFPCAAPVAAGGKGFQWYVEWKVAGVVVVHGWEEVGCGVFRWRELGRGGTPRLFPQMRSLVRRCDRDTNIVFLRGIQSRVRPRCRRKWGSFRGV